ncbi:MAG: 4-(cytidine 5'-diphospho)-2-C-methyl-D-erythritol kinase [Proteobacteria bacterium]|nr:4-(cytidine 5'-diphospho)-2-C-methyl-D-erythritol kinase [Pseudomonadota bacterium]
MTRVFAPAKINLFLHVGDRRADGYHELESLVAFADVGDDLVFEEAGALSLTVDGPFGAALAGESDNLILWAAHGVAALAGHDLPRRITLTKNLPVASGIGGGSADAAATLRAFLLEWRQEEIRLADFVELAKTLGADVPVCFFGHSAWMYGVGDGIERTDLPELHAVLVNPGMSVATRDVFSKLTSRSGVDKLHWPEGFASADEVIAFLKTVGNDLEAPALSLAPAIGEVLKVLRDADGARLARMSGSGATCFGLFADQASAQAAATQIARDHAQWWVKPAILAKADES